MLTTSITNEGTTTKPKAHKRPQQQKPKKMSKADQNWMANYERLRRFKQKHGHTYVSRKAQGEYAEDPSYHSFAKWVSRQISAKSKGKLRKDREQLLKDIDFYFNTNDYGWDLKYKEIERIKQSVGHADIPSYKGQMTDENKVFEDFMGWAEDQRLQYALFNKGFHCTITQRRISKLNDIGFIWSRDDDDAKRIEEKAENMNIRWITRRLDIFEWHDVLAAIASASAQHKATGKPTVAEYRGQIIAKEADGTIFLVWPDDLDSLEVKNEKGEVVGYNIVAFE